MKLCLKGIMDWKKITSNYLHDIGILFIILLAGYMVRQPLYSCLTCAPAGSTPGGLCLACTYSCHDGCPEIVELYTKRNFCCDCGNDKYPKKKCKLVQDKRPVNSKNK